MKTLIATIGMLLLAAAPVVTAEPLYCDYTPETGTDACVVLDPADPVNRNANVNQQGVGGASYSSYEYGFFGMTFRGQNVFVYTANDATGFNMVSVDNFCGDFGGDGCDFESTSASVFTSGAMFGGGVNTVDGANDASVYGFTADHGSVSAYAYQWEDGEGNVHAGLCYSAADAYECSDLL
jgi:hypothetical protein